MNWLPKVIRAINKGSFQQNADKVPLFKKAGLAEALGEILVSERKLYSAARKDFVNLPRKFEHEIHNLSRGLLAQFSVLGSKGGYFSGATNGPYGSRQFATKSEEEEEEAWFASPDELIICRDIEQNNRYTIFDSSYDPPQPAGFICEQSNGVFRRLLPSRRPFVATIFDLIDQKEVFRVRRPFWWMTSSIYVEVGGKEIGVVHRRWHLWRRIYDLYLGDEQFAVVENTGFFDWTFTLKGINGELLAEIEREWRGVGLEGLGAKQYVIRFDDDNFLRALFEKVQGLTQTLSSSEVAAVTIALVVSLDDDVFSRHGRGGVYIFNALLGAKWLMSQSSMMINELFKF